MTKLRIGALAAATLAAFALLPPMVHATTNLTVANCNDHGNGSLRNAIGIANASADSFDIDLSHLACSRISLTTGALAISNISTSLRGPGAGKLTISGDYYDRVIMHTGAQPLFLYDLRIVGGKSSASGGCLYSTTGMSIRRTDVAECEALGSATVRGGAIYSKGSLFFQQGTVSDTLAYSTGGDVYGGVISANLVILDKATISNGYAQSKTGGAFGGGIATANLIASYSLIVDNRASAGGGVHIATGGNATITASTVSGNSANQCGGGIYSKYNITVHNSTIAFNRARRADKSRSCAGGGLYSGINGKSVALTSTLLSNNVSYDGSGASYASDFGAIAFMSANTVSGDHDLIVAVDTGSRAPPTGTLRSDPHLQPLRSNGGIPTHALRAGSTAIDHGSNPDSLHFDQRGRAAYPRVVGTMADIGAFEFNPDVIFVNGLE